MRYRVITREEFDEHISNGTIKQTSSGYWNTVPTKSTLCLIKEMFRYFGQEIPDYQDGVRFKGFGWNDWMVKPLIFEPEYLNDKIILTSLEKRDLKEYYTKEPKE